MNWTTVWTTEFPVWARKQPGFHEDVIGVKDYCETIRTQACFRNMLEPHEDEFVRCGTCTGFVDGMKCAKGAALQTLVLEKEEHVLEYSSDAQEWNVSKLFAQGHPTKELIVTLDQSDSRGVPHHKPMPSYLPRAFAQLDLNFGSVIVHSFARPVRHVFAGLSSFKKDVSLILTQLWIVLWAVWSSDDECAEAQVLRIHTDGTSRENNNQIMFAFCGLLLCLGLIKQIRITMLVPGHTFSENDSTFRNVSLLRYKYVHTHTHIHTHTQTYTLASHT